MAAAELLQPGVEVIQVQRTASPTFLKPSLSPVVVGPAFEVIKALGSDGTLNSKAKYGSYGQIGKVITQSAFPDPRGNIDELDIDEASIRPFMLVGGGLSELLMSPGDSFLTTAHYANKAVMKSSSDGGGFVFGTSGSVLIIAIDQPVLADTTKDIVITLVGTLTAAQTVAAINEAVGFALASVVNTDKVQLASPTFGYLSSLTVRAGGSANALLALGFSGGSAAHEERVVGAGFRGQDDSDGDSTTPWIEFYRGGYILDGAAEADGVSSRMGWIGVTSGSVFTTSRPAAVTFSDSGTIPLKVGDSVFGDGTKVKNGEVMKVEASRFKVGTVNTALSTADDNGRYTSKVYDTAEVGLSSDLSPFAPAFVWVRASNLKTTPTPSATAASVTGSKEGIAATSAVATGSGAASAPFALAGLTLDYSVIVDGVQTDGTFTFSGGPFANMAAVVAAITITGLTPSDSSGELRFTTVKTGQKQGVTIHTTGTASTVLGFASEASGTGKDVEFPSYYDSAATTFPTTTLTGKHLDIQVSTDGGTTWGTAVVHNFSGEMASVAALVTDLAADATFDAAFGSVDIGSNKVRIYSRNEAPNVKIRIATTDTADGAGNLNGVVDGDVGTVSLNGTQLVFTLNDDPHQYKANFTSNSIVDAVTEVNTVVSGGATVASSVAGSTTKVLKLTSFLKGMASKVLVSAGSVATALGLSTSAAAGTKRPYPDAYLDGTNSLVVGSEIIRDSVTGYPLDTTTNPASLYIQFKALRKDVSPVAANAGVLRLTDQDLLEATLSPLTDENPLGLAAFLMMINAPGLEVKALGVDEVTAAAPEGTQAAYARASDMLAAEEVYAIAPLTQDEVVHQMWSTHVSLMSEPEQGGERIVFVNKAQPSRKVPGIALSGSQAGSTVTENQLQLDASPAAGLVTLGVNPALPLTYDDGVFVEVTVANEFRRYLVTSVSGSLLGLSTTFAADENVDGFLTTTDLTESVIDAAYAVKVLGLSLVVPGSNPQRLDYSLVASTLSDANASIKNRRVFSVYPGTVTATVDGSSKSIPGYYACAAIVGMVAAQPPQQGFTNFPMTGLTGVVGTEKFTKKQLNIMAGGGTYILQQPAAGAAVSSRQQVSTDLTSIEHRELSITKVVDFTAKFIRAGIRKFIGVEEVNDLLIDTLGTTVNAMLAFLVETGVLIGANVNNIIQDASAPDTILIDVTLKVPFPCNYVRVTLVV